MTHASRMSTLRLLAMVLASASALACGSAGDVRVLSSPTVTSFTATPSTITAGETSTLAWDANGATSININHEVGPVTGTSAAVRPTVTTTYTLTATNGEGSTVRDVTVTVNPAPTAPVIDTFVAGPSTIAAGDDVTLMWSVRGATSLSIDQGVGPVTGTSTTARPLATTKYTLTATNAQGSVKKDVTVIVNAATAPVIASFTAAPSSITVGESSTLAWSVTGATSVSINQSIGTVPGSSKIVNPTTTTTYVLTATNDAGSVTKEVTISVWNPSTAPAIGSFTATPSTITTGEVTTLAWQVTGADSVSIDQGVGPMTGSSKAIGPLVTTTYTLTATNGAGSKTASVTVTVVPPPPVITSFTATPSTITAGGTTTLAWNVSGATSLSIDQNVGPVAGTSTAVKPLTTTTYTLSATNGGGTAKAVVTVTVEPVPPPVIASFTATPAAITAGGATTLAWNVTGASSVTIDQGVGTVTGTSKAVSPTSTTTYTLTATNGGGTVAKSVTVTVTPLPPVISAFTASPATISRGTSSTLAWTVTGADSLTIDNGIGGVTGASKSVTPTATTTYTLTATNAGGTTTKTVTVTVNPPLPVIASFTALPTAMTTGETSTLTWSVSGADSLSIDQGVGVVTGTSKVVSPLINTTYTLTASNAQGSVTATVTVTVTPPPPVIVSFTATQSSITTGGATALTWNVTGASSITIDQGVGAVTGTSKAVSPAATTTYTLTATNGGGTVAKSVTVTVTPLPPVISSLTASPATIVSGTSSILSWTVTGADGLSIDNGIGGVTGTSKTVSPTATTTYTLTATNAGGSTTKTVTVTVTPPLPVISAFTASPASVYTGGSSTLAWTVSGADTLALNQGIGTVTGTSKVVNPTATTIYTLSASNATGTVTRNVTVTVTTPPSPPVINRFEAVTSAITASGISTLSWDVTGADALSIDQGVGSVTGTSRPVAPVATTTYKLTATNAGGAVTANATVTVLASGGRWVSVDAGVSHNVAIREDGSLWAWGYNGFGQIGDGTTLDRYAPVPIGAGFVSAAAGENFTLAVKADGTLWAWGSNYLGQLGDGTTTNRLTPVQIDVGYATVAGGGNHSVAVKADGTLWAWGNNSSGQVGDGTQTGPVLQPKLIGAGFSSARAGGAASMATKTDKSLWVWGTSGGHGGTITAPVIWATSVVSADTSPDGYSAWYQHSIAVKADGSLWVWGPSTGTTTNSSSPTQVGSGFAMAATGQNFSVGVKSDGTMWAAGDNSAGQLGDGTTTSVSTFKQVDAGYSMVSATSMHTVAIKSDGSLWSWGSNANGRLGDGSVINRLVPVPVFTY